jgi:hypothetical protein
MWHDTDSSWIVIYKDMIVIRDFLHKKWDQELQISWHVMVRDINLLYLSLPVG